MTALVRQVYARIQATKPQVIVSASFVAGPLAGHQPVHASQPYYDVYSDWDSWMQEGIVDFGVPMDYFDDLSDDGDFDVDGLRKDRKATGRQ